MEALEKVPASVLPIGHSVQPDLDRPMRPVTSIRLGGRPPLMPGKILFGAMPDRRLRFRRPIPIEIYRDDDSVIARTTELDEFGCGASIGEALDDVGKTLAEEFVFLSEHADRLSEAMQNQFRGLSEFLEYRRRQ